MQILTRCGITVCYLLNRGNVILAAHDFVSHYLIPLPLPSCNSHLLSICRVQALQDWVSLPALPPAYIGSVICLKCRLLPLSHRQNRNKKYHREKWSYQQQRWEGELCCSCCWGGGVDPVAMPSLLSLPVCLGWQWSAHGLAVRVPESCNALFRNTLCDI